MRTICTYNIAYRFSLVHVKGQQLSRVQWLEVGRRTLTNDSTLDRASVTSMDEGNSTADRDKRKTLAQIQIV